MASITPARSAVVTGCARGIGLAIAQRLSDDGFHVVGVDIDPALAEQAHLSAAVVGDVRTPDTRRIVVERAEGLASLHAWVNNAAVAIKTPLHSATEADVRAVIDTNLMGTLWGCQAAVESFLRNRTPGVIVNLSSIQAVTPFPGWAAYAAAKGGVESLTRYIAVEYGGLGIRAVAVAPGTIATDMSSRALADSRIEDDSAKLHPLGHLGATTDVAGAVSFLASSDAAFVSGTTLTVDGAATARCYPAPAFGDAFE